MVAVQDFGALYASVKSHGKSMGQIIETYIGKTGRKLFFLFCWLFTLLVIAAFADMVAGSLNGYNATGAQSLPSGAASSITILYVFVAIAFGFFLKENGAFWMETSCFRHCTNRCYVSIRNRIPCLLH